MEWNEIIPVFSEEGIDDFRAFATNEEQEMLEEWYGVGRVENPKPSDHIVSVSLFWKHVDIGDPELPELTMDLLRNAQVKGMVKRFDPWGHYIEPLLAGAKELSERMPWITVRVYLAKDMEFLLELLTAHCEVRVMKSSSIRHSPGALWRFLAMEDANDLVTYVDSDNMADPFFDIEMTTRLRAKTVGCWRMPTIADIDRDRNLVYRSIVASRFGTGIRLPIDELMRAFTWHALKGNLPSHGFHPAYGRVKYFGHEWPGYCFDEWFLMCAVLPKLGTKGCLTYIHNPHSSYLFPLDLQFVMRMNPDSEVVFG